MDQPYTFSDYCLKCPTPFSLTCSWLSLFLTLPCLFSAFPSSAFSGPLHIHTHTENSLPCSSLPVIRCIFVILKVLSGVVNSVMQLIILVGGGEGSAFLKELLDSSSPTEIYHQIVLCMPLPLLFCLSVIFHLFSKYLLGAYYVPRIILYFYGSMVTKYCCFS